MNHKSDAAVATSRITVRDEPTVARSVRDLTDGLSQQRRFVTVMSGASMGKMFEVDRALLIGREPDCDILLDEESVSRHHARLQVREDGQIEVCDLKSTNGTHVNACRVERGVLHDGDSILVGSTVVLRFDIKDELEHQVHRQLYDASIRDGLTGTYNKRYLLQRLNEEFSYCARHRTGLALCLMDIDNFKEVNDAHGHLAGDMVLMQAPKIISSVIRLEDVLCRYGGDEFAILLREREQANVVAFAERIRKTLQQTPVQITIKGDEPTLVKLTVSIGVACYEHGQHRVAQDLLMSADEYLYAAKRAGRDRIATKVAVNA